MDKTTKHISLFFVISFAWTWLFYFAIIAFGLSPYEGTGMILLICGGCSPTFVGIIMALTTYSKENKIDFFKRCYQVKHIGIGWWLFILFIFPTTYAISILIDIITGGTMPEMESFYAIIQNPLILLFLLPMSFLSGPFAEELGWRGFVLQPLLDKLGFTKANILLGFIWCFWHLPLFFMPETWHGTIGTVGLLRFLILSIGLSFIMAFVFMKTKQSILSAVMLHLTSNFTAQTLANYSDTVMMTQNLIVLAIGIAMCFHIHKSKQDISV